MIDFFASIGTHYIDHLAPYWHALTEDERGDFLVAGPGLVEHAAKLGITARGGQPWASDAPLVVAGAKETMYVPRVRSKLALVEHGAGQSYVPNYPDDEWSASYSGGMDRDRFSLFLTPGEISAARNRDRYPSVEHVPVGPANLDRLMHEPPPLFDEPTVAVVFHWNCPYVYETHSAFSHYARTIAEIHATDGYRVVAHFHPRSAEGPAWAHANKIEIVAWEDVMRADQLWVDNSSIAVEFAAVAPALVEKLVVFLNAPEYRRDVEHGMRFWDWPRWGVPTLDEPEQLRGAVETTYAQDAQKAMVTQCYGELCDGLAAERGADVLRRWASL